MSDKPDVAALIGRASPSPDDGWDAEPRPSVIPASPDVAALIEFYRRFDPLRYGIVGPDTAAFTAAALQSQQARIAELEQDAARYRWLCDGHGYFMEEEYLCGHSNEKAKADAAIDAARAKEGKP
jgi:hypothetical protein